MRSKQILLTAAFAIMSALTVHTANAQTVTTQAAKSTSINNSALPYTITKPGTYVLTGNMSYTSGSTFGAINIIGSIEGPVVVDLKGFTITSDVADSKAGVVISGGIGTYPTTIRNGTITTFANGINASGMDVFNGTSISNITVKNVTFNQDQTGVSFHQFVNSSTVNNCIFNSCGSGIIDSQSIGGNSYSNNTFVNTVALTVDTYSDLTAPILNRCQFAPPPTTNLLTSAITAQTIFKSASIPISSLPFTITAPGTYVLTRNLSYIGGGNNPAISINGSIAGPVVVDLKGFTVTSDAPTDASACVSISGGPGLYPITIRNGTITKFEEGIYANSVSNIAVHNIAFNQNSFAVSLAVVDSSTIYNCTFNSNIYGIEDINSTGGNSYNNNNFGIGGTRALYVEGSNIPLVLDSLRFRSTTI